MFKGGFSSVYKAIYLGEGAFSNELVAIKRVNISTGAAKLHAEMRMLKKVQGLKNIISTLAIIRGNSQLSIVFPYFCHDDFRVCLPNVEEMLNFFLFHTFLSVLLASPSSFFFSFSIFCLLLLHFPINSLSLDCLFCSPFRYPLQTHMNDFNLGDIRLYMGNLFIALQQLHDLRIIHRDIKPSNFLFNIKTSQFRLVDFGLAHTVRLLFIFIRIVHHFFFRILHPEKKISRNISRKELLEIACCKFVR